MEIIKPIIPMIFNDTRLPSHERLCPLVDSPAGAGREEWRLISMWQVLENLCVDVKRRAASFRWMHGHLEHVIDARHNLGRINRRQTEMDRSQNPFARGRIKSGFNLSVAWISLFF